MSLHGARQPRVGKPLTCPQRLKGAIDSRIAEEQARQKSVGASGTTVARSASTSKRPTGRTDSPARPRRPKPKDNEVNTARGPDPSEFENAFVIEDESEEPSRVGIPAIGEEKPATMAENNATAEAGASGEVNEKAAEKPVEPLPKAPEVSPEIRTKLKKLDRMESKYQGRGVCSPSQVNWTDNSQSCYDLTELHMLGPFR
jgi:hypothetical protein